MNVIGTTEIELRNLDCLRAMIADGLTRRHHGKSAFNSNSSRSHAIFQIALKSDYDASNDFRYDDCFHSDLIKARLCARFTVSVLLLQTDLHRSGWQRTRHRRSKQSTANTPRGCPNQLVPVGAQRMHPFDGQDEASRTVSAEQVDAHPA